MIRFRTSIIITLSIFSVFTFCIVKADLVATTTVTITAVVIDPNAPPETPPTSGGGGGGSGGGVTLGTQSDVAVFKGNAYPGSIVTLLKNGVIMTELPASPDGTFEIHIKNLNPGTYSFGIRAEDADHLKSTLDLYTIYVSSGVTTVVDGIFIPPTITTDKLTVKQGDIITLMGKSVPDADLTISIHSLKEIVKKTTSTNNGSWVYKLDSSELEMGPHEGKVRAITDTDLSLYSDALAFNVGTQNIARPKIAGTPSLGNRTKCDLNSDLRVNLLDFSIMAFWYKRSGFPAKIDLNNDGKINLTDLSILAYCWTG